VCLFRGFNVDGLNGMEYNGGASAVSQSKLIKSTVSRLDTFVDNSRSARISSSELASFGFIYIPTKDSIQCPKCRVEVIDWRRMNSTVVAQERHAPNCTLGLSMQTEDSIEGVVDTAEDGIDGLLGAEGGEPTNTYSEVDLACQVESHTAAQSTRGQGVKGV
jgi:hypothetical protein